jgi:polyisoprenoid-binding protein YceI
MPDSAQRHQIGPDQGTLILRTSRQGAAAKAGHDLTIEVTRWSGEVSLAADPAAVTVTFTAELGSLRVLAGTGGIKPLSDRDRREIVATAQRLLDTDRQPTAEFTSTSVTADAVGGGVVTGTLRMLGKEHPLRLEISRSADGGYRALGSVRQSEYGLKPYTAFFGALKLADTVAVEATLDLPDSSE